MTRNLLASLRGLVERTIRDPETARHVLAAIDSTGSSLNGFEMWTALDERVGKAEPSKLRLQVAEVRSHFVEEFTTAEIRRLQEAFEKAQESGWRALISTVADAVSRFRWRFALRICEQSFPLSSEQADKLRKTGQTVRAASEDRWVEANDQIASLANNELVPAAIRAKLLAFLAQIQLIFFSKADEANQLLDKAALLAPHDAMVLGGLGDLFVQKKNVEQAKMYYEKCVSLAPSEPAGYVGMGECFENEKAFDVSEDWYQKAVDKAGGDTLGYSRLLRLCGQPELFSAREKLVQPLLDTIIAVRPEEQCSAHVDAGMVYEKNGDLSRARAFYEAAVALNPSRPSSYTALAGCCEKQKKIDEAESFYKKAIEVAPQSYDGYWGLTWLYEQGKLWEEALAWYRKTPQHNKQWAGVVRAKVGEMLANLEQYSDAESLLANELLQDKSNDTAREALHKIAEDYYNKLGKDDDALRLYGVMLSLLGENYTGEYHNRLGNLYYFRSKYEQAEEHYRQGVARMPAEAAYRHNLAGALRELNRFDEARQELRDALKIDHDEKKFTRESGLVENAQGNYLYVQARYREAVRNYEQAVRLLKDDAIVHSNLAGAWEKLNEGNRSESIANAIEALEQAERLEPTRGYGKRAQSLRQRLDLARTYGEKIFSPLEFVNPIRIEIAPNLVPMTQGSEGGLSDNVLKSVTDMKARIVQRFGVQLPGVRFRSDETLPSGSYVIALMEVPFVLGSVAADQRFYSGEQERLSPLGITASPGAVGNSQIRGWWIQESELEKARTGGLELWDSMEYVVRHLETILQFHLAEFVGHQEVASLLTELSREKLESFRSTPEKLSALTAACKGLVVERVPIAPFSAVCDIFEKLYSPTASGQRIVETIRTSNPFRNLLPGNSSDLAALTTGPRIEASLRSCVVKAGERSILAMEPELCQSVLSAVRNKISTRQAAVYVDDPELRPLLRLLVEMEFPAVPVLSKRELQAGIETNNASQIELDESEAAALQSAPLTPAPIHVQTATSAPVEMDTASTTEIVVFVNRAFVSNRAPADERAIEETFPLVQEGLYSELGILLPAVRLELDDRLAPNEFRFRLNGVSSPVHAGLAADEFLVNDTVDRLRLLGIEGRAAVNPANGNSSAIVREGTTRSATCREVGLTTWGPIGFLVLVLSHEIRRSAASFQTAGVTQYILESFGALFPDLVDAAKKRFSTAQILGTLKALLDEGISIRDLRTILESMLSIGTAADVDLGRFIVFVPLAERLLPIRGGSSHTLTVTDYSNWARCALKRYLSHKYAKGNSTLIVYLIAPEIERRLADCDERPLTEDEIALLAKAVREEIGVLPLSSAQPPVLLTSIEVRKTLRDLLKKDYPDLPVLSYQELSQELNIQPIARISWN